MKKLSAIVLALVCAMLMLTSCSSQQDGSEAKEKKGEQNLSQDVDDKWLLSYETHFNDEYQEKYVIEYEYDKLGRLNYKKFYGDGYDIYTYTDFEYDENNNVTSCIRNELDKETLEKYKGCSRNYKYSYDESGNCLSLEWVDEDNYERETVSYEYNENREVISEITNCYDENFLDNSTCKKYKYKYTNGVCTQAEISVEYCEYYEDGEVDKECYNEFQKFFYDENGNKIKEQMLQEEENEKWLSAAVEINGCYYRIIENIEFTWTKFSETKTTGEIGFDNPNEWGCKLIEIECLDGCNHYIYADNGGKCVIINGAHIFEFYTEKEQLACFIMRNDSIYGNGTSTYNVLDNDLISVSSQNEGSGMIRITDRTKEKNIDILGISRGGDYDSDEKYISYSLIDESRAPELYEEGGLYNYYKLYLK